jgi:3-phosphoglycerate kinase
MFSGTMKECRMSTIMDGLSTIDGIDVDGGRVPLWTDFNVPLRPASGGASVTVADDTRVRAALTTIEELLRRRARMVLVSHLDWPAHLDPGFSMRRFTSSSTSSSVCCDAMFP